MTCDSREDVPVLCGKLALVPLAVNPSFPSEKERKDGSGS